MANLTDFEAYNFKNEFLNNYFEPLTKEEATRQIFILDKIQDSEDVACIRSKKSDNNARAKSTQSVPFFVQDWEKRNKDIWKISGRFLTDDSSLDLTRLNINNVRVYFAPGTSAKNKELEYLHSIALDVDPTTVETIQNLEYYMEHFYNILPFNMIINSGNGLHIYFNFDKPVKLTQSTLFHLKNIKDVISFIFSYLLGLTTHTLEDYEEAKKDSNKKKKKANTTQSIMQKMSVPGSKTKFYTSQNQAVVKAYRAKKDKITYQDFLISISNFVELFIGDLPNEVQNKIKLFIENPNILDELVRSQVELSKTDLILEDFDKLYHLSSTPHKLLSSSKESILKNVSEVKRLLKQQDERRNEVVRGYRAKALKGRGKMLTILGFTRNLASNLKQFNKCLNEPLEDKEVKAIISEIRKLKGNVAYNHRTFKKDHGFYYVKRNRYINNAHKLAEEHYYYECGLNYGHGYGTFVNPTHSVAAVYSENPSYYLMNREALANELRLRGIVGEKQYAEARNKVAKFFSPQAHNNYMMNFKRLRSGNDLMPRPLNFVNAFNSEASAEAKTPYRRLTHTERAIQQFQKLDEALAIIATLENTTHWNKYKEKQLQQVSKFFQRFRTIDQSIKTAFLSNELNISLENLIQQGFNLYDRYNNVLIQRKALVKNGNYSGTEEFAKSILTNFNEYRKDKRTEQFIITVSNLATNKVFTKSKYNNYSINTLLYRFKRNQRVVTINSNDVIQTYLLLHNLEDNGRNQIIARVNLAYELNSIIKDLRFNSRSGHYTTIYKLDKETAKLTNEPYGKKTIASTVEVESFIREVLNPLLNELKDNLIFEMEYSDLSTTLPRNSYNITEKLNRIIEMNLNKFSTTTTTNLLAA